ncbi:MAG TPA: hypothetical protein PK997_06010 [Candidatus Omnitrophota bacterium]|jgi:hypothetical protein|nr:hypothetical protein [Candidatus Omnitrophota bacterium]HQB94748.1 hypothetical protein [Candidatus Omnitrophota bacterium]
MKTHPFSQIGNQRGFVLTVVYLILALVAVFSVAYFSRCVAFVQANERNIHKTVAFNMAESGIDWAISQLASNTEYTGTSAYVPLDTDYMRGGFTVSVITDDSDPKIRIIRASGFAPSNDPTQRGYQTSSLLAYVQSGSSSAFRAGIFATDSIQMSGNAQTDSYDSRNGAYGGSNVAYNGGIETNTTGPQEVTLSGNVMIQGGITVGPTESPSSVVSVRGNAMITGSILSNSAPVTFSDAVAPVSASGELKISGNTTYYLMPGTYHFTSMSITGNAKLVPTGPVSIYVDGTIKIAGNGIATADNRPPNLLLYATGNSSVSFSGNASFYGAIYAPNSTVSVSGNGRCYGAIIAKDYKNTGNGQIHFDEALKEIQGGSSGGITILAWQEQNTLLWGTGTAADTET